MGKTARQNHGGGNHRTGERTAAGFVDAGNEAKAAGIILCFEIAKLQWFRHNQRYLPALHGLLL